METIAVTKPNMTVTRQEALSPFGLLTELFTEKIAQRSSQTPGFYRPMNLAYLEEEAPEAQEAAPELHVDLNLNVLLDRLLKEAREREKSEKKPETPAERILERVVIREKELRTSATETRRIVIETAGRRFTAAVPVLQNDAATGAKSAPATGGSERKTVSAVSAAKLPERRTAAPIAAAKLQERKPSEKLLPLASQMLSVPAAGGWTPQQRELHPGYPVKPAKEANPGQAAGSILLPDVLRRRREEAIARSETQRTVVSAAEGVSALEDALTWAVEDAEPATQTEQILRQVRRAVEATLRRNANAAAETPANNQQNQSTSRQERREFPTRAHARAIVEPRETAKGEQTERQQAQPPRQGRQPAETQTSQARQATDGQPMQQRATSQAAEMQSSQLRMAEQPEEGQIPQAKQATEAQTFQLRAYEQPAEGKTAQARETAETQTLQLWEAAHTAEAQTSQARQAIEEKTARLGMSVQPSEAQTSQERQATESLTAREHVPAQAAETQTPQAMQAADAQTVPLRASEESAEQQISLSSETGQTAQPSQVAQTAEPLRDAQATQPFEAEQTAQLYDAESAIQPYAAVPAKLPQQAANAPELYYSTAQEELDQVESDQTQPRKTSTAVNRETAQLSPTRAAAVKIEQSAEAPAVNAEEAARFRQERAEEAAKLRAEKSDYPDAALPSAIPVEAIETTAPAALIYREEAEESSPESERRAAQMQPETQARRSAETASQQNAERVQTAAEQAAAAISTRPAAVAAQQAGPSERLDRSAAEQSNLNPANSASTRETDHAVVSHPTQETAQTDAFSRAQETARQEIPTLLRDLAQTELPQPGQDTEKTEILQLAQNIAQYEASNPGQESAQQDASTEFEIVQNDPARTVHEAVVAIPTNGDVKQPVSPELQYLENREDGSVTDETGRLKDREAPPLHAQPSAINAQTEAAATNDLPRSTHAAAPADTPRLTQENAASAILQAAKETESSAVSQPPQETVFATIPGMPEAALPEGIPVGPSAEQTTAPSLVYRESGEEAPAKTAADLLSHPESAATQAETAKAIGETAPQRSLTAAEESANYAQSPLGQNAAEQGSAENAHSTSERQASLQEAIPVEASVQPDHAAELVYREQQEASATDVPAANAERQAIPYSTKPTPEPTSSFDYEQAVRQTQQFNERRLDRPQESATAPQKAAAIAREQATDSALFEPLNRDHGRATVSEQTDRAQDAATAASSPSDRTQNAATAYAVPTEETIDIPSASIELEHRTQDAAAAQADAIHDMPFASEVITGHTDQAQPESSERTAQLRSAAAEAASLNAETAAASLQSEANTFAAIPAEDIHADSLSAKPAVETDADTVFAIPTEAAAAQTGPAELVFREETAHTGPLTGEAFAESIKNAEKSANKQITEAGIMAQDDTGKASSVDTDKRKETSIRPESAKESRTAAESSAASKNRIDSSTKSAEKPEGSTETPFKPETSTEAREQAFRQADVALEVTADSPIAIPANAQMKQGTPAELVFREEAAAPGNLPTANGQKQTARTAEQRQAEENAKAVERQTEVIAKPAKTPANQGTRSETAAFEATRAKTAADQGTRSEAAAAEVLRAKAAAEETTNSEALPGETTPLAESLKEAELQIALPVEAGPEQSLPTELIYREDAEETEQTAAQNTIRRMKQAATQNAAQRAELEKQATAQNAAQRATQAKQAAAQRTAQEAKQTAAQRTAQSAEPPSHALAQKSAATRTPGMPGQTARDIRMTSPAARSGRRGQTQTSRRGAQAEEDGPVAAGAEANMAFPVQEITENGLPPMELTQASPMLAAAEQTIRTPFTQPSQHVLRTPFSQTAEQAAKSPYTQKTVQNAPTPFQAATEEALPLGEAARAALPLLETPNGTEPVEMVLAAPTFAQDMSPEQADRALPPEKSDKTELLPVWAKELLEKSGVTDTAIQAAAFRNAKSATPNVKQIQWSAPGAINPAHSNLSAPADLSFKERPEPEQQQTRNRISDAELQRTADKVYKIIEERLRRELRRSGR